MTTNNHPATALPCSVKMGPGGMDALVTLGAGDMRRTLNILQVRPVMCMTAWFCADN